MLFDQRQENEGATQSRCIEHPSKVRDWARSFGVVSARGRLGNEGALARLGGEMAAKGMADGGRRMSHDI